MHALAAVAVLAAYLAAVCLGTALTTGHHLPTKDHS
jgi:hypothetical protein